MIVLRIDVIFGDGGSDHLVGGFNADTIYGGLDHDIVDGTTGPDGLNGGGGHDVCLNWNVGVDGCESRVPRGGLPAPP